MVNIIFWNCGICPKPNSEYCNDDVLFLEDSIKLFIDMYSSDIIIITEVNERIIKEISKRKNIKNITPLTGRGSLYSKFDFMVVNSNNISILKKQYIRGSNREDEDDLTSQNPDYAPKTGRTLKIGVKLTIKHESHDETFDIISSHWSSKVNGFNEENRKESAEKLKKIIKSGSNKKQIILIGDYNSSPYSSPIIDKLEAVHNRHYASLGRNRIYNLSSSFSPPHLPYKMGEIRHFHGTWLSKDDAVRRNYEKSCMVFDQIMCTSSFISSGPWHINELETEVVHSGNMIDLIYNGKSDHFPIRTKIEYQRRLQVTYE